MDKFVIPSPRDLFTFILIVCCAGELRAQDRCTDPAAILESTDGRVEWHSAANTQWQPALTGAEFCYGDQVRVLEQRAALRLANDTLVRLQENSLITLLPQDKGFWFELLEGAGHFLSRTPKQFTIKAPYVNAAIDGTELIVTAGPTDNRVAVLEGEVRVGNNLGEVRLRDGMQTVASATTAPHPAQTIRLRDAAEWTLYYPPLIVQVEVPTEIQQMIDQEHYGEALEALSAMDTPQSAALAASLAFNIGKPEQGSELLKRALSLEPQQPDALALQALRSLTNGDSDGALRQTEDLIKTHPQNVSVLLAHAYALQGQGKIEEALRINQRAQQLTGNNLFILARSAELQLSSGNTRAAQKQINRALKQAPQHSRLNTLAGFIALNRFANKKAQGHFQTAIQANGTEPLARLGLALALIQKGKIDDGQDQMEMAVLLDPSSSLLRSYLGKTYATQNRDDWADTQYQLAKNLDPNDPTPWFYQGLHLQQQGDLIAAVYAIDKSRELNDNRATYRSRLLLDKDSAVRAAGVGHLYQALGFTEQAVEMGIKSISDVPEEHSGHRLLAELYADDNRYESLRASERLQATMLQPLGTQPLPLGLSEAGMLILDGAGPADMGINEYNRLFVQGGLRSRGTVLSGSQNTRAYDFGIGGYGKEVAFDVGHYRFQTDGFRVNNDVDYAISSFLSQWQPQERLSIQAEVSQREEEQGDLGLRFDLDNFSSEERTKSKINTYRLGATLANNSAGQFMISLTKRNRSADFDDINELAQQTVIDRRDASKTETMDLNYTFRQADIIFAIGGFLAQHRAQGFDQVESVINFKEKQDIREVYAYATQKLLDEKFVFNYGLDVIKNPQYLEIYSNVFQIEPDTEYLPKFGVKWSPVKPIEISSAYFETYNKTQALRMSLKPTHIGSFAQLLEGAPRLLTSSYAAKITATLSPEINLGYQHSIRNLTLPQVSPGNQVSIINKNLDSEEKEFYADWKAAESFAANIGLTSEQTVRSKVATSPDLVTPLSLKSEQVNLGLSYKLSQSARFDIIARYVHQHFRTEGFVSDFFEIPAVSSSEYFSTLDLSISKYFTSGHIGLAAHNLFDREIKYADFDIFTSSPRLKKFVPERTIFIHLSLAI